jgi:hypothetical protein
MSPLPKIIFAGTFPTENPAIELNALIAIVYPIQLINIYRELILHMR